MFRRCVSLLVIVGLFASQLAAIPHAHGATSSEEQQKHDAKPHIHLFGHCSHSHSHSHAKDDHHHHHDSIPSEDESANHPLAPISDVPEHDSDAFYFVASPSIFAGSTTQIHTISAMVMALQTPTAGWAGEHQAESARGLPWHPPDTVLDDSETYLTLRTLRI
jgi:hypothetical protein